MEKVVEVDMSEVFWDQSRAEYPRIIAQKCSNRHGRFLTIEEFDGRRRCGTILIPEGRFISKLRMVNASFKEGQELREGKVVKVVSGRWSYVEVLGLSTQLKEECFNSYKESITRVPRWLKEASAELERRAQKDGKLVMVSKNTQALANVLVTVRQLRRRPTSSQGLCEILWSRRVQSISGWLNGGGAEGSGI